MNKTKTREFIAKELSKDWYIIKEKGKKQKKVYFEVYLNPSTNEIQIGEKPSTKELYGTPIEIYASWKALTRQLIWNYNVATVFELLHRLCYEQSNLDQMKIELSKINWGKKLKSIKWKRYVGGMLQSG